MMADVPQHEMAFKETPWVIIGYMNTDEECDKSGFLNYRLECCICGVIEHGCIKWPPKDDPIWNDIDPMKGLSDAYQRRTTFQLLHLHPDRQNNPILTWAKPLKNLDAIGGTVDLEALAQRLRDSLPYKMN
jgi:hypothetical protein